MLMSEFFDFSYWWIFPLMMMVLCFFMMRGRRGAMMCGFGSRDQGSHAISPSDSPTDILDKRYALGEITTEEYAERKSILTQSE